MRVLTEVSRRSNCVEIVWKGNAVVSRRKERARRFYKVGCSKVKLEQEGEVSCGKVCEESAKKVARVRCEQKISGARWVELELGVGVWGERAGDGAVILKTRQTRYVDGQSSKWWRAIWTLWPCLAKFFLCCSISQHSLRECTALSHIGSRMAAVLVYGSRQCFSTSVNPNKGGTFEENFARWLAFHSSYVRS